MPPRRVLHRRSGGILKPPHWAVDPARVDPEWAPFWRMVGRANNAVMAPMLSGVPVDVLTGTVATPLEAGVTRKPGVFGLAGQYGGAERIVTNGLLTGHYWTMLAVVQADTVDSSYRVPFGVEGANAGAGGGYWFEFRVGDGIFVWNANKTVSVAPPGAWTDPYALAFVRRGGASGRLLVRNLKTGQIAVSTSLSASVSGTTWTMARFGNSLFDEQWLGKIFMGAAMSFDTVSDLPTDAEIDRWAADPFGPFRPVRRVLLPQPSLTGSVRVINYFDILS